MEPDELEQRLRNGAWPELRPGAKAELMRRARQRLVARGRQRLCHWALAAAAALLVAINLVAEGTHARRMEVIVGRPAVHQLAPPTAYANALRYRAQLLSETIGHLDSS